MRKYLFFVLVLLMVFALAACGTPEAGPDEGEEPGEEAGEETEEPAGESDLDYVLGNGEMIIGYTVYAPMNYTDDAGNFTGFDTELAIIVCEKLGVEPNFEEISWDTKEVELNAKSIDCIWNGMGITPDRQAQMEITDPYAKNAQVVLMKADAEYGGLESLADKIVAAEQGSTGQDTVEGNEFLSQASFVPKTAQIDCLMEVKAGAVDAAVLDLTLAKSMTGPGTNYEDLAIVDFLDEEFYGVGFRKGSDLCDAVNKIFAELVADGTLRELADKYGLELAD